MIGDGPFGKIAVRLRCRRNVIATYIQRMQLCTSLGNFFAASIQLLISWQSVFSKVTIFGKALQFDARLAHETSSLKHDKLTSSEYT